MIDKIIRWRSGDKIHLDIIQNVERHWNIRFPKEYVNIVVENDGSRPQVKDENGEWKSGRIDIPKLHTIGFRFISFQGSKYSKDPNVLFTYNAFKECLPQPKNIYPFAEDGGGNILLFDYRNSSSNPEIVFLNHERAYSEEDFNEEDLSKKSINQWLNENLYYVCDSFSELVNLIYAARE